MRKMAKLLFKDNSMEINIFLDTGTTPQLKNYMSSTGNVVINEIFSLAENSEFINLYHNDLSIDEWFKNTISTTALNSAK